MYCKLNGGKINFYQGEIGQGKIISKIECIHKSQKQLKDYLKKHNGHYIKFLNKSEIKKYNNRRLLDKLCEKDTESDIATILEGDIEDIIEKKIPNRFIAGVFKKNNTLISISSIYKQYTELYFSASCSKEQDEIRRPNYFIRAFSILELLKYNKFDTIHGMIGGSEQKLIKYHEDRGCKIERRLADIGYEYKCEIVIYLNNFFNWLNTLDY